MMSHCECRSFVIIDREAGHCTEIDRQSLVMIDREARHCTEIDNDMFGLHDLANIIN